jgi:DNA-binding transcriptional ArsR family regulator
MKSENLTQGKAYTSDLDYNSFVGAPREAIIYDWSIRAYRKVVMQCLATHDDRVTVADPDALLNDETWEDKPKPVARRKPLRVRKDGIRDLTRDYMQQHGAITARELATELEMTHQAVSMHLMRNEGHLYVRVDVVKGGGDKPSVLWGLAEIHSAKEQV